MFKKTSTMIKSKARHVQLMKKYITLALIGAIVAGVAGLISIDTISATSLVMMQDASDFHESGLMIGHVTYEVRGADGEIKQYLQSDNLITNRGTDCSAIEIFDSADTLCPTLGDFAFIAIGNATGPPAVTKGDIALRTIGNDGEMARSPHIDAIITANNGVDGTIVKLSNSGTPFTFTNLRTGTTAVPSTTIYQSGLFNTGTPREGDMFSIRDLDTPIAVTNADTLAVTWTITLK